jgi:hypothetical protein
VACSTALDGDLVAANNVVRDSVTVLPLTGVTEGEGITALPRQTALLGAQPNPMRQHTGIRYDLAAPGFSRLAIFDIRGAQVRELVAKYEQPGSYEAVWNGRDTRARPVAPGVYFCRMLTGSFRATTKLLLTD